MTTAALNDALRFVREGAFGPALSSLLEGFRSVPHPRIADLVGKVSALAEQTRPAIAGKNLDSRKANAIELLGGGDPADLPRVLRLIRELRIAQARELVAALSDVPSDPRILDATLGLLRDPPFSSSTSMSFWRALLAVVEAQGDPRTRASLDALDFAWLADWSAEQFKTACARVGTKKGKAIATAAVSLEGSDEATCAAIEEALGKKQGDGTALLAAIRENPDDDAARAVYADWLEERGDPRGRFINLQLRPSPTDEERKAARALLEAHAGDWLGELAAICPLEDLRFTRGFLSALQISTDELPRLLASEHAPTVEWLSLYVRSEFDPNLLRDPRFRALRFVGGLQPAMLDAMIAAGPFGLRGIGLDLYDAIPGEGREWTNEQRAILARVYGLRTTFPELDTLAVRAWYKDPGTLDELFASPLCKGLRRLHVSGGGSAAKWFGRQHLLPSSIELLEISFDFGFHDWATEFRRDAEGKLSRMIATLRPKRKEFAGGKLEDVANELLDELPPDVLTEVEVRVEGARVTNSALETIVSAARRHTKLRALSLPGRPSALPSQGGPPVKTARERAADAHASESTSKLGGLVAATSGLIDDAFVRGLDLSNPDALRQLLEKLPKTGKVDPRWAEVALAIFALPVPPTPPSGYSSARRDLIIAALGVYARSKLAQPFTRLRPLLGDNVAPQLFASVLSDHAELIEGGELPIFLDWFETLAVKSTSDVYYTVKDLLAQRDDQKLRTAVQKRFDTHKLNRFHRWTYEDYLKRA